jgi:hypothetical protein
MRSPDLLICAICFALLLGINLVYAAFAPALFAYLFVGAGAGRLGYWWGHKRSLLIFSIPFAGTIALLLLYNWVRFANPFSSGYHFAEGEGFIHPLPVGLAALFFSSWRGLFFYSPVLLLVVLAWPRFRRDSARLALLIVALVLLCALGFASWWSWHGGVVWGTRFLLPVVPLLSLLLLPVVGRALQNRLLWALLAGVISLSAFVQGLGALYSYIPYDTYLQITQRGKDLTTLASGIRDEVLYDFGLSPILGHLALWWRGYPLEAAWASQNDLLLLAIPAALLLIGLVLLLGRPRLPRLFLVAACMVVLIALPARQAALPSAQPIRQLASALATTRPSTVLAISTLFDDALLDLKHNGRVITMNAPTRSSDPDSQRLWADSQREQGLFWLLTWFGNADPANWQEQALWQGASFIRETFAAGHRALLFDLATPPAADQVGGWRFGLAGEVTLVAYGLRADADGLYITLQWRGNSTRPLQWFAHLLDHSGQIISQQDRLPQGGYASFASDGLIEDHLYLPAPNGISAARIGIVDPSSGATLFIVTPNGKSAFLLVPLEKENK